MAQARQTVLQRKAGAERPPPEYGHMTPGKAIRLSLSKAGQDILQVQITTGVVEEKRLTVPRLAEAVPEGSLVALLDGPGDVRGLIALDSGALTAVIEALTTGKIGSGPVSERKPTLTDGFLTTRFLNDVLSGFGGNLEGLPEGAWARGFSVRESLQDLQGLPLLMEDVAYRLMAAPLEFGGGARQGNLLIVLPWEGSAHTAARPMALAPPPEVWAGEMERSVMAGEAVLEAVLHRMKMPVARVAALRAGDLVPIPSQALDHVALHGPGGEIAARGRLGQAGGNRAVRIAVAGDGMPETEMSLESAMPGIDVAAALPADDPAPALPADPGLPDLPDLPDLPAAEGLADLPLPDIGDDAGGELPTLPMSELPPIIE